MIGYVLHDQIIIHPRAMYDNDRLYAEHIGAQPMEAVFCHAECPPWHDAGETVWQIENNTIVGRQNFIPWTLEKFRAHVALRRFKMEVKPIMWEGHLLNASRESRAAILQIDYPTVIKFMDGTMRSCVLEEIVVLQNLLKTQVREAFEAEFRANVRLDHCETFEEMVAVVENL